MTRKNKADVVVSDLSPNDVDPEPRERTTTSLPSALDRIGEIKGWQTGKKSAIFLDFDGTLAPIVDRPEAAVLSGQTREILSRLLPQFTVAVISGRDLSDVRTRVDLDTIYYAGSHGFDIHGPGDTGIQNQKGAEVLPALDEAEKKLHRLLVGIEGVQVERKTYSIAVHYRLAAKRQAEVIEQIVDRVLNRHRTLRKGHGKKVFELQPDVEWDKGRAVLWLLRQPQLSIDIDRTIYIGDDVTDEDAFHVLQDKGIGIVVHGGETRPTYASWGLVDTEEVERFLRKLLER